MKHAVVAAVFVAALVFTGCVAAPVIPPTGIIYTEMSAPISLGGGGLGTKRGESSVVAILGLFSTGDGSVAAAARAGGIRNVQRVDYDFTNFLGLYQRYTTVAYGD